MLAIHPSSSDFVTPASERTCCKAFALGSARPVGSLHGPAATWFATRPSPPAITTRKTKGRATTPGEARPFGMRFLASRRGIRKTLSTAPFEKPARYAWAPRNPSRGPLMSSTKRAALYVRVSTDAQTVENQIRELRQVAGGRGWDVIEVYSDAGISGAKGRNGRPGLDSMLKDANQRKFD